MADCRVCRMHLATSANVTTAAPCLNRRHAAYRTSQQAPLSFTSSSRSLIAARRPGNAVWCCDPGKSGIRATITKELNLWKLMHSTYESIAYQYAIFRI
jgi:hypothetical protein